MESIYVHMCDLQVAMKTDRSLAFGVGSPYSQAGAFGGFLGCEVQCLEGLMPWGCMAVSI
jgi:hypothetical protein